MTKSIKKVAAITSAVMIAASLSVVSMAADYAEPPVIDEIISAPSSPSFNGNGGAGSGSASSAVDTPDESADSNVETAVNDTIDKAVDAPEGAEAPVAAVKVTSTKALTISADTISKLADVKDAKIEIKSPKMTITIDAATVKSAKKVNLSSTIKNSPKQTVLTFASKKDFGCAVKVKVTSCKLSRAKLKTAHVYCDGEDLGPVELDSAGNPIITVTKGGKYVIK